MRTDRTFNQLRQENVMPGNGPGRRRVIPTEIPRRINLMVPNQMIGGSSWPQKARRTSAMLACLLSTILVPSAGWSSEEAVHQDPAVTAAFLSCDSQAERKATQATRLTPVDPISVLSPILLLDGLNRQNQEKANQPQLLNQIELERQQCRQNVVAMAARRAQEIIDQRSDTARGYKPISFESFALDSKSLAAGQARVSMVGAYLPDGNFEWLFTSQREAMQATMSPEVARNISKVPLFNDDASRDFRKILLKCKSTPGSDRTGCLTIVTGHVSLCSITGPGGGRDLPCLVVENGRAAW
jgi:hypothetical protein